jgi:hypothetical protein
MSKQTEEYEEEFDETDIQEIEDDDYGFVFGSDGEIKYVFVPEVLPFDPPKTIKKIMKILGVTDLSQFCNESEPPPNLH